MTDPSLLLTTSGVDADEPYGGRDPAQELYAHAAGVLANAQALEASAGDPGTVAALAPTLACFETSLAALAQATSRLRVHALRRLTDPVLGLDERHGAAIARELATTLERLAGCSTRARSRAPGRARRSTRSTTSSRPCERHASKTPSQPAEAATVMLSQADYDATVRELEALRAAYHANLAALEDVTIDELRIAHLKRLLASATVVAGPETLGAATLGSVVRARKDTGRGGRLHARGPPRARRAAHARHARFAGGQGAAGRAQR